MERSLVEPLTERSRFLAALVLAVAAAAITYGSLTDHRDATLFLVVIVATTVLGLLFSLLLQKL